MSNLFGCKGRIALVTGASRGLGLQAAAALAEAGATVILNARDQTALEIAADQIRARGGSVETVQGDLVTGAASVVEEAVAFKGRLDIVVHAAAARDRRSTSELPGEAFRSLVENNLACVYDLGKATLPYLSLSKAGRLIFLSSIAARMARAGDPAYAAAKGGVSALTRAFAVECGKSTITVNAIAPGFFATETNQELINSAGIRDFLKMRVPSQRCGRPDEIASAVLFLASTASSYVNGITLTVDGGLSAQM